MLTHTSDNCVLGYSPCGLIDEHQEDEANAFALELLAPVCVLDRQRLADINSVSSVTLLDEKRSRLVVDEIKNHKKFTEYELKLCNQFEIKKLPRKSIKRKLIIGSLCFVLSVSVVVSINHFFGYNIQMQQQFIDSAQEVFITKSGDKYHNKNCKHITNKKDIIHMSISEAETAGYKPCNDCKPNKK